MVGLPHCTVVSPYNGALWAKYSANANSKYNTKCNTNANFLWMGATQKSWNY